MKVLKPKQTLPESKFPVYLTILGWCIILVGGIGGAIIAQQEVKIDYLPTTVFNWGIACSCWVGSFTLAMACIIAGSVLDTLRHIANNEYVIVDEEIEDKTE